MKITSITPYGNIQNNFKGKKVYHTLKKGLLTQEDIRNIIDDKSKSERFIGSLPKEWIEKFNNQNSKKENTEKVFKAFAQFAKDASNTPLKHSFACKYHNTGLNENLKDKDGAFYLEPAEDWNRNIEKLETSLREIIQDNCKVTYVVDASYGIVFKVQIADKTCALKIFLPEDKRAEKDDVQSHGALCEIANIAHLSSVLKPSQCSKLYCAKLPSEFENDGFMLTGFKENNHSKGSKQRMEWFSRDVLYWGKYTFDDAHDNNFIDGALIDFGAIEYTFSSRKTANMAKEFFQMILRGDVEAVKDFKQKHENEPEFKECMAYLQEYIGQEEDTETTADFAYHCYTRKLTKKIIASFEALGADYSRFKNADLSEIYIEKHKKKFKELFYGDD